MIPIYNGKLFIFPFDGNAVYDRDGNRYLTLRDERLEKFILMSLILQYR